MVLSRVLVYTNLSSHLGDDFSPYYSSFLGGGTGERTVVGQGSKKKERFLANVQKAIMPSWETLRY
jgi:hypothetical protein